MTKQRTYQNFANAHRKKCTVLGITVFLLLVNICIYRNLYSFGVGFVHERATIVETRPVPSSSDDYFIRAREQLRLDGTFDNTETDILLQLLPDNQHERSTGTVTNISLLTVYLCTVGVTWCLKRYGVQNLLNTVATQSLETELQKCSVLCCYIIYICIRIKGTLVFSNKNLFQSFLKERNRFTNTPKWPKKPKNLKWLIPIKCVCLPNDQS